MAVKLWIQPSVIIWAITFAFMSDCENEASKSISEEKNR